MRLDQLFHVSFYVTLALASATLTLPSTFFLPWMPLFLVVTLAFVFLAWRHEGVWEISETTANQIGVLIAIGAAGWILFQIPRSVDDLVVGGVNWPAGMLPHLSPLLMVLLVVKLFRPKRFPDYWAIQTMGLMMVTLASVLADDDWFGPFVLAYFASLMWSLMLYYPIREQAVVRSGGDVNQAPLFARTSPSPAPLGRLWGIPRTARWTVSVVALGYVLFLAAPRQSQSQWNARHLSNTSPTGSKSFFDAGIDLNKTGTIALSEEPAFTVSVRDRNGKSQDAAHVKRWRVEVLETYGSGRWFPHASAVELAPRRLDAIVEPALPEPTELADDEWLVTFQVKPAKTGGLVAAEPLNLDLGIGLNPRLGDRRLETGFIARLPGRDTFAHALRQGRNATYTYSQVIRVPIRDTGGPAQRLDRDYITFLSNLKAPAALVAWTADLLQRLSGLDDADRQLPPVAGELESGRELEERRLLNPAAHEKVAQALCNFLAMSGEYQYSLDLRRHDRNLDPTVDFLINVKEGHCERYAGGLALMLRAVGIPCRVVRGYLGAETDENGQCIVRQNQAHSWVQALVPGEQPGTWRWLMLDPTPVSRTETGMLVSWWRWCQDNLLDTRIIWRQFIMEYTPEQQWEVLSGLGRSLFSRRGLFVGLALLGIATTIIGGRRFGGRLLAIVRRCLGAAPGTTRVAYYDEFLRLVQRHAGLAPGPGQTPGEFAAAVAARVHGAASRPVAERIVAAYYRERFGGRPLTSAERAEVTQLLKVLHAGLTTSTPAMSV